MTARKTPRPAVEMKDVTVTVNATTPEYVSDAVVALARAAEENAKAIKAAADVLSGVNKSPTYGVYFAGIA